MNTIQPWLLAPVALGLLAPMAASAKELNLDGVNRYASQEQVTSISQFSDVRPTDWAYQALSNLIERYGCVAGYPNGTYKGGQAMTRFEAAALLNACLDRITEVTDELRRLMKEFEQELAVLKGRVDGLEAKVGELEASQFSTTTKLSGLATFVLGANAFGGTAGVVNAQEAIEGATTFNYDVRLNFDTSFTGKDLLRTTLRAGNFGQSAFFGGTNQMEVAFEEVCNTTVAGVAADCGDVVAINRLFYQFPIGSGFTATIGGKVRIDDMLAMWPSVYPADTILDTFTYAGAPGAYNLAALGGGAGIWYAKDGFSFSTNYVSTNSDNSNPNAAVGGGIGTDGTQSAWVNQLGYTGKNWGAAVAYTYARGLGLPVSTPFAAATGGASAASSSVGLSAYWQPSTSGWIPSISTGWGWTGYNNRFAAAPGVPIGFTNGQAVAQSWYVGLQWTDVFVKGNSAGMAVGQVPYVTATGFAGAPNDANYAWEWWYKFQVTDNISVTPAIYYISNSNGQFGKIGANPLVENTLNNFGAVVKTTFKF
ncbi:MAG: iron uptake porin [Cyanobium sp.]